MPLQIQQYAHYEGSDWWKWSVWIQGPDSELDQIASVTYILHPTFQNPVRTIGTRSNKFRLDSAGWGIFVIRAKIQFTHGETKDLKHQLELLYEDGTPTTA